MNSDFLTKLNSFIGIAAKATYAGGGASVTPWRKGFKELEYKDGDFYYRDSYTGYFRSWGQETVWYKDEPIWTARYGGGMTDEHQDDKDFADKTFSFLKNAMSAGEKVSQFQPRGPKEFTKDNWSYICNVDGDMSKFSGNESISFNGEIVFTHQFIGGLIRK
jgi:hypothetical protein